MLDLINLFQTRTTSARHFLFSLERDVLLLTTHRKPNLWAFNQYSHANDTSHHQWALDTPSGLPFIIPLCPWLLLSFAFFQFFFQFLYLYYLLFLTLFIFQLVKVFLIHLLVDTFLYVYWLILLNLTLYFCHYFYYSNCNYQWLNLNAQLSKI